MGGSGNVYIITGGNENIFIYYYGNGNTVMGMGGNGLKRSFPHISIILLG